MSLGGPIRHLPVRLHPRNPSLSVFNQALSPFPLVSGAVCLSVGLLIRVHVYTDVHTWKPEEDFQLVFLYRSPLIS